MEKKLQVCPQSKTPKKKVRNVLEIQSKLEILEDLEKGMKAADIARSMGLAQSTIRSIKARGDKLRECAEVGVPSETILTKLRPPVMERMEKLLYTWIQDSNKKKIHLTTGIIQDKAQMLFNLVKSPDENINFSASRGWFEKFKKRYSLRFRVRSTISDYEEPTSVPRVLREPIEARGVSPNQEDQELRPSSEALEREAFSIEDLSSFFHHIDEALNVLKNDPDKERSKRVSFLIMNSTLSYKELYEKKKLDTGQAPLTTLCEASTSRAASSTDEDQLDPVTLIVLSSDED